LRRIKKGEELLVMGASAVLDNEAADANKREPNNDVQMFDGSLLGKRAYRFE
jgi:hypothetical protein